jgi:dipeptidyl aminopeptidase/acylaminoacyl peptidase
MKFATRLIALVVFALGGPTVAQAAPAGGYEKPAKDILDVMHAPPPPRPLLSPTRDKLLLVHWVRYDRISDLAEPMLRLGGIRVNPRNNAPHGAPYSTGLSLRNVLEGAETAVSLPAGARIGPPIWNATGTLVAFSNTTGSGVELWVLDAGNGRARRISGLKLNQLLGDSLDWMPDQKTLLVKLVPRERGTPPALPLVPPGPRVEDSAGGAGASSTYEARDLLKGPHDADLFDHYCTSQLALVNAVSGKVTRLGKPAVFAGVSPAPGGRHLLVQQLRRPYSYLRAYPRFPREVEVWSPLGEPIEKLASLPLAEKVPIDGVPTGPRDYSWQSTAPATLIWEEALDGGDPRKKVPYRDRVMLKPMGGTAAPLLETEHRFAGVQWIEGGDLALISDFDRDRRWIRTFLIKTGERGAAPRLLWDRSQDERYKHPGNPMSRVLPSGAWVVLRQEDWIYLDGPGGSPKGDRPFLDRLNLRTLATERLFRSPAGTLESVVALVNPGAGTFITRRESPSVPPNLFLRTLAPPPAPPPAGKTGSPGESAWTSASRPITSYPDPTPQIRGITKKLVTYQRADGVPLSFTLYLPPAYKPGARLPALLWAYPLDYAEKSVAGQVAGSPSQFTTIQGASSLYLLLRGYAVLQDVAMPVVGPPRTVYDTFIEQIVANAKAAIDKAAQMGVIDPERVGVAGHSHGALMTANLLAHSDLFRAGLARSGAYNHTTRPFGFQNEKRTLWEARDVYARLSPVIQADKIDEPLLLVHGEVDANPGTVPIQSEKLFEALRGVGGTVRLVMLPHESHGYRGRESIEHVTHEMLSWFDKYVKNAAPRPRKQISAQK